MTTTKNRGNMKIANANKYIRGDFMEECSTCPSRSYDSFKYNKRFGGKVMKIAISSTGKTSENLLDMRFGRCEYFQIHDTENGKIKILENKGPNASGGAGIVASTQLIEEKVDVIITGNLGPNAFELIEKAGIKAYKSGNIAISLVLDKYNKGELEEIKISGPSHH